MISERTSRLQTDAGQVYTISALLFIASAALTISWCGSMSAMGEMPMPGGWTMPMTWMLMPGETWLVAAASFIAMWAVMMIAMMLPSLAPMLMRYRQAVAATSKTRLGWLTVLVGLGYFFVWTLFGMIAFPLGLALAAVEMQFPAMARAVPIAAGAIVVTAGAIQFTPWKAHHLACCQEAPGPGCTLPADARAAWRHGLRLGFHCCSCCAGPIAILLVIGVMNLGVMAVITAAITVERFAPAGRRFARASGTLFVGAGLFLIARAAGLGLARVP
jgi:predicted metal-binding membrane protein